MNWRGPLIARDPKKKMARRYIRGGPFRVSGEVKHPDLDDITSDLRLMQGGVTRLGDRGREKETARPVTRGGPPWERRPGGKPSACG
jgi:hypothetical protein